MKSYKPILQNAILASFIAILSKIESLWSLGKLIIETGVSNIEIDMITIIDIIGTCLGVGLIVYIVLSFVNRKIEAIEQKQNDLINDISKQNKLFNDSIIGLIENHNANSKIITEHSIQVRDLENDTSLIRILMGWRYDFMYGIYKPVQIQHDHRQVIKKEKMIEDEKAALFNVLINTNGFTKELADKYLEKIYG